MRYYLAVDVGASSGRLILGWLEGGALLIEEVHRFENEMVAREGRLCWDLEKIFGEIICGMKKCGDAGRIPQSIGVDTWGVDFVLVDGEGEIIGDSVAYRDNRTDGMDALVFEKIDGDELYARTGVAKQLYNTIFQLMAVKKNNPEHLRRAAGLLMIPDYLHYRLSGAMSNEYTNATTSGLINIHTRRADEDILARLDLPDFLFGELSAPGRVLGRLRSEVAEAVGFDCDVVLPASHDTASAVIAASDDAIFISSGTWSLMGVGGTNCSEESRAQGFTNEGGYDGTLLLKNIMGLWMIQSVRGELDGAYGYAELCEMAARAEISSLVDCNDARFFAPKNMTEEIKSACAATGQKVPQTPGELASVVYRSLADCYAKTASELEARTGKIFDTIHIIGGGANADFLNQLTATRTGKTVITGPTEATAIGNIAAQMLADGTFGDLTEARKCIRP
ncbi:MAG: rhamnulokinase [Defluviitaleaceae bacterium]|nr:rhamnulokinase [Defluviitaleaceae bacterium]